MKTIKLTARGSKLAFRLEDSTNQKRDRVFLLTPGRPQIIPLDYAKSIYNSPAITKWIKEGALTIEGDMESLQEDALAGGYIENEQDLKPVDRAGMLNILKGVNKEAILELFRGEFAKVALELVVDNKDNINMGTLELLEEELKVPLIER